VSLPKTTAARLFYIGAAATLIVLAFIGFGDFYLRGMAFPNRPIAPPLLALVVAHGIAMSLWLCLLLLQPILIQTDRFGAHRRMGVVGALLAVVILVLGILLAIRSTQVAPPDNIVWGLSPKPFMAIPFLTAVVFAGFVATGVLLRHQPHVHRSMMLIGTLAATGAGISRIAPLNSLYVGTPLEALFGPYLWTIVLGFAFFAVRCVLTRSIDRPLAIGLVVMTIAMLAIVRIAPTAAWLSFAKALAG